MDPEEGFSVFGEGVLCFAGANVVPGTRLDRNTAATKVQL